MLKINENSFKRELAEHLTQRWQFVGHGKMVDEITSRLNKPTPLSRDEAYRGICNALTKIVPNGPIAKDIIEWLLRKDYCDFIEE